MGDRWILSMKCPNCFYQEDDIYYAPTCGFTTWSCPNCHKVIEEEEMKVPDDLPKAMVLLKDLPGIRAGVIFELTPDGYYTLNSKGGYAAYDWWTVSNLTDWWKPANHEDLGRWFD